MEIKHSRVYTAEFVDFVDKFTLSDKGFCRAGDKCNNGDRNSCDCVTFGCRC